jgi:hypothetical protein
MKLIERCSGRGFDSLLVHQKAYWTVNIVKRTRRVGVASMLPNGPDLVSTEQVVEKWTIR